MQGYHLIWVAVLLAAGYVIGRYYPALGHTVGLP